MAYTAATPKPATMKAARIMWVVCTGVAGLSMAAQGSGSTTFPAASSRNPVGWFIQALAVTTNQAEATPATTTGTPVRRWARGESRSHP